MTTSVFDDAGHMVETINPDGHATHDDYDADGNQTGVLDADGNLTQYLFNSDGEQTETIDPTNHDSYTYYDADGQVTGTVDQLGQKIGTEYDADGNVTGVVWTNADGSSAGLETFTFDHADEMLTAANSAGEYSFTYNGAGNVASVSDPFGITLTMGYDAGGNRTSVSDNDGGEVASTFDAADQLATRSLTAGGVTAGIGLSYNAAGEETARTRTADGVSAGQTDTLYDASGDVTSIVTHSATGGSLLDEQYTYDGADRLASKTSDGSATDYGYDDAGQLTSAGSQSYTYDSNGVPTSGGLTPGSDNQVSTDGTWNYSYNLDGELTAKTLISGGTSWSYAYDINGNMTSATETVDGAVTVAIDYQYDVFGNLVGRTETDSGTVVSDVRYAVDGWDTAQPSPTGNENYNDYATLVPSGDSWTVSSWTMFGAGFDQPVATITSSGAVSWYGVDRQGSVETVFDNSGTILASASYDAYGNILSGGVSSVTIYGFQGGQYDSVTGLTSFGARWYDPVTQQWTSRDPLGLTPGPNASEFVSDGPTDGMDPSGQLEGAGDSSQQSYDGELPPVLGGAWYGRDANDNIRIWKWWKGLSPADRAKATAELKRIEDAGNTTSPSGIIVGTPAQAQYGYLDQQVQQSGGYNTPITSEDKAAFSRLVKQVQQQQGQRMVAKWESTLPKSPPRPRAMYPEEELILGLLQPIAEKVALNDLAIAQLFIDFSDAKPDNPGAKALLDKIKAEQNFAIQNGASPWEAKQYAFYMYSGLTSWHVAAQEATSGQSLHAQDFGRDLSTIERVFKGIEAILDLITVATSAAQLSSEARSAFGPLRVPTSLVQEADRAGSVTLQKMMAKEKARVPPPPSTKADWEAFGTGPPTSRVGPLVEEAGNVLGTDWKTLVDRVVYDPQMKRGFAKFNVEPDGTRVLIIGFNGLHQVKSFQIKTAVHELLHAKIYEQALIEAGGNVEKAMQLARTRTNTAAYGLEEAMIEHRALILTQAKHDVPAGVVAQSNWYRDAYLKDAGLTVADLERYEAFTDFITRFLRMIK